MKHYTYYKIADIVIQVSTDFVYHAENSYMYQFVIPACEPNFRLEFREITNIQELMKKAHIPMAQAQKFYYCQDDEGTEYCFHSNGLYYHAATVLKNESGVCFYISEGVLFEQVQNGYYLENFFCLEKILLQFQCMVLHSCHIHTDREAILFSAPSGTGKSTQGELWKLHAGAEIINGDRTAIRNVNGNWIAYGVPFCGTSGIDQNRQAPLKAIVSLKQAPYNEVRPLPKKEAFLAIYSELTVNSWNKSFVNHATEWTMELINAIPILRFSCTRDAEAVRVLKNYLLSKGESI